MREREIRSFFANDPQVLPNDVERVGINVVAGLELGSYRELKGGRFTVVNKISRSLLLNQALLGITMPIVIGGSGSFENKSKERVDYLAFSGLIENTPIIVFSWEYLKAQMYPDLYGSDLSLREMPVEEVVAHECFHIKQRLHTPWKLEQDTSRADLAEASWNKARSEVAARRFAEVFDLERTRLQRERNTVIFLQDMGIDPTGIITTDVAALQR